MVQRSFYAILSPMKHRQWIAFSGFSWLAIGVFLLYKGLHYMADAAVSGTSLSFQYQELLGNPQQVASAVIGLALLIGYVKGRFILSKTVQRVVQGIRILQGPIRLSQVYSKKYGILISSMMGIGMLMKILPIPVDVRGFIDIAVGSALVQGALLYFRAAKALIHYQA